MKFTVDYEIPKTVANELKTHWKIIAKKNLEDLAVIGYKTGILTSYQVQLMLNHESRWETEEFFHKHKCYLHYSNEDFEKDGKVLEDLIDSEGVNEAKSGRSTKSKYTFT